MNLRKSLKILLMLFKMKLSKNMAFRFSFFGVFFVDGTLYLIQLLMFSAIYSNVESIGDWNKYQMILFICTFLLIDSLNMALFFFGVYTIPEKIKTGQMDLYITKPINSLFHISFESIDVGSLPLVFITSGIIGYATSNLNIELTLFKILGYCILVIMMLVLYYDLMVLSRTVSFFFISTSSIERLESEVITLCFKIPGTLFKGVFKLLFSLILPYGLIATVPAQFLSGTLTPTGLLYSLLVVCGFTALTIGFWRFGLKNYKSVSC